MDFIIERTHIIDHPRFLEAGAIARDLWEWGMKYSGKFELDGEIPMSAVLASAWGYGGRRNIRAAAKLVEVGLWERTEKGYRVLKWTEQGNKTRAQLDEARRLDREKKAEQRKRRPSSPPTRDSQSGNDSVPEGQQGGLPEGLPKESLTVPVNCSGSGSLGGAGGAPPTPPPEVATDPPAWFASAIETVEASTGEKLRPADSWLRYSGHRAGKGIARGQQDAVYWLTTVMVPEARRERREEAARREREAKFDRDRDRSLGVPDAPRIPTDAEAMANAERIRKRLAARKGQAA